VYTNSCREPGGVNSKFYSSKPLENQTHMEKSGAEFNRYQYNMPNYFRYLDNPNYRNIKHTNVNGQPIDMMHIVSKNQGWITVDPKTNDRKHPIEKRRKTDA
jgi:uncharacterized protein YbcV (DUF1398 family)